MASDGHWMEKAVSHPGSFRKAMGKKAGQKITSADIAKGKRSKNPTTRRRAALAATFAKFRGGKHNPGYDAHRGKGALDMDRELAPMGGSMTVKEAASIIGERMKATRARAQGRTKNVDPGPASTEMNMRAHPHNSAEFFNPRRNSFDRMNRGRLRTESTATGGDLQPMGGMRSTVEAMEGNTPLRKKIRTRGKARIKVSSQRGGGLSSPLFGGF